MNPSVRAATSGRRPHASGLRLRPEPPSPTEEVRQRRMSNLSALKNGKRYDRVSCTFRLYSDLYLVWHRAEHPYVHPARPEQCGVDEVRPGGGRDHEDAASFSSVDPVELGQQLVDHAVGHARAVVPAPEIGRGGATRCMARLRSKRHGVQRRKEVVSLCGAWSRRNQESPLCRTVM